MERRKFLKATGALVSLPVLLNGFRLSAMPRQSIFQALNNNSGRVLVLIQLNGGNDGLNTLIPIDQYDTLANARANILIPESGVLNLNGVTGLHPVMDGIRSLYEEARAGFIQSVGYPSQNRSHFRSTDIWTSGSPADEDWTTGWLGRYFEDGHPSFPDNYPNEEYPHPFAITMGSIVSETCQGNASNFSLTLKDPFSFSSLTEGAPSEVPDTPYGDELTFLRTSIAQTNAYSEVVVEAAEDGANLAAYPEGNRLAQQLKNVALLVSGGLQTQVYVVTQGGYDTHANQADINDPIKGNHAALLQELSLAVAAFQADLQQLGKAEQVLTMTFSEFGRQIRSNDSFGTDHGTAAPLMVFGPCVNPGILGNNPEIPAQVEPQAGVPIQYDFRDVYGSVLMAWFELEEDQIRTLLHPEFQYLPIVQPCSGTTGTNNRKNLEKEVIMTPFPNPFREWLSIRFLSEGEWVKLSLFNSLGNEIRILTNQRLPAGQHEARLEARGLPAGNYYIRIQLDGRQKSMAVVKL